MSYQIQTNEINILLMKYLVHCTYYCLVLYIDEHILLSIYIYIYIYIFFFFDNRLVNIYSYWRQAKILPFVKFEASFARHELRWLY